MTDAKPFDTPAETSPGLPPNGAHFGGNERAFWKLLIRGAVLLLVTLGIYRFWLATEVRRFLWSNTEIAGDGLEYIGSARELLIGFLIAIVILVPVNIVFFLAALGHGWLSQIAGLLALLALALLGQFAVYRARRYRLTRAVYRGIRFHQTGSAWRYAVCAIFWWGMVALTLGLGYPWAQASLERFKLRNTYYGDLQGHFVGSGTRLFFRGLLLWLAVVVPLMFGLMMAVGAVDWAAVGEAMRRGGADAMSRVEAAGVLLGIGAALALAFAGAAEIWIGKGKLAEFVTTAALIASYVVVALAYSTIYQASVKLRLWKTAFESIELTNPEILGKVKAAGAASSAVGEGLADALNVGGI